MEQFQNSCFLAINLVDVIAFAEDVSSYFPHGLVRYLRDFVSAVFLANPMESSYVEMHFIFQQQKVDKSCMGQPSRTDFSFCHLFGSQPAVAEHPPRFGSRDRGATWPLPGWAFPTPSPTVVPGRSPEFISPIDDMFDREKHDGSLWDLTIQW